MSVPLFDTRTPLAPLRAEIDGAIKAAVDDGRFILGPNVAAFEEEFAAHCGAEHTIGVANGTDALTIALRAMGVGPGDDVVVPSFTFYASAEAIPPTGARPVFCDVDRETCCVTPDTVRAALTPRTKAVMVVHLFGNVAPVAAIEALGVPVLEDAAQAAGSMTDAGRPGALGTAATFSFFPSKNLGAFGDGGAITTRDAAVADRARMLRFHGSWDKVTYEHVGYNSRLDDLQAAILRVQLPHLDGWADGRRAAGEHYREAGLAELVALPRAVDGCRPAWHLYVVRSERAGELAAGLGERAIGHKAYYRTPVHRQPAMAEYGAGVDLPATDEVARTHLAIPMSPVLDAGQVGEVVGAVGEALGGRTGGARRRAAT
ncbi:MAG: DegT/DnrJ/EryC1/StrS family aminotransferase [Solirubrobacteraceae bacterium MAG38_C4-C5]|nr:DegT/DnrJ/EryC1/StrS family aminotransferase [Candidatus Siliceabacter maunaloa]